MLKNESITARRAGIVTLRTVADKVGLAPCSVSAVLNNSPAALAIPQRTKNRVLVPHGNSITAQISPHVPCERNAPIRWR